MLTVRWADKTVQTKKIETKNNLVEWFEVSAGGGEVLT